MKHSVNNFGKEKLQVGAEVSDMVKRKQLCDRNRKILKILEGKVKLRKFTDTTIYNDPDLTVKEKEIEYQIQKRAKQEKQAGQRYKSITTNF